MQNLVFPGLVAAFAGSVDTDNYVLNTDSGINTACFAPDLRNNTGWILCDGTAFEPALFPQLYAVIGTIYGTEDDTGLPLLPNYQGYFLRGVLPASPKVDPNPNVQYANDDRTAAANGSDNGVGSTQEYILQDHEHQYENYPAVGAVIAEEGVTAGTPQGTTAYTDPMVTPSDEAFSIQTNETRPANIYVFYLISTGQPGIRAKTVPGPQPPSFPSAHLK